MLEHFRQDLWLALRGLRKAKGFALAAILTLAVGSAGTTVMFALIQGVLLKPLPVDEQDRVLVAWQEIRASGFAHYPFRAEQIDRIGRDSQLLQSVAGVDYNGAFPAIAVENDVAVPVTVAAVKGDLFGVLGVGTTLGRSTRSERRRARRGARSGDQSRALAAALRRIARCPRDASSPCASYPFESSAWRLRGSSTRAAPKPG